MIDIVSTLASVIAVLFVLIPHEFAHAYAAYKNGDATAKMYGRLTLNPVKHLDPLGFVLCVFTGFGWARPVPIYPYNFKKYRVGLFTTAIAGVVTNYIIAFIAFPLYLLFYQILLPTTETEIAYYTVYLISYIFYSIYLFSLSVFVFNILPLNPLDGFRVVESFTREINPVRRFLRDYGQYILIFLVVECFICNLVVRYTDLYYFNYFNLLGYYLRWFANIIGFPISALWDLIFGL